MGKNARPRGKNRSTTYVNSTSNKTNDTTPDETPADTESDSDKCEQCNKQTDQQLQRESCNLWFCCACQNIPAGMMIALSSCIGSVTHVSH